MKLVGYIRKVADLNSEKAAGANQRRQLEAYCAETGHELVEVFEEAEESSQEQFHEAIEALKTSGSGLVAVNLDQIARNAREIIALVDMLQMAGKDLVLVELQLDTTQGDGKAILKAIAVAAKLGAGVTPTQAGRRAKAASGGYAYGAPPFGKQAQNRELVDCPKEQMTIELIYQQRQQGKSLRAIASYLNLMGYPPKRGERWNHVSVKNVLDRHRSRQAS